MAAVCSFAPIVAAKPVCLILGSMPGERSLDAQQYYAHPQNAFWKIMGVLLGAPVETYSQRVNLIKRNNLALWDVLAECVRPGSLDSAIRPDSVQANDFATLLSDKKTITHIFFNGGTAEKMFMRHVWKKLPLEMRTRLTLARLPSTSPAMASLSFDKKVAAWRQIMRVPAARTSRAKGV